MLSKWDKKFIGLTNYIAYNFSKDFTKVAAVIVNEDNSIISTGYNGLPRKIKDNPNRLLRPIKYKFSCHAECNGLINAARNGISTKGCRIYVNMYCCAQCAAQIINAGISEVICPAPDWTLENWKEDFQVAHVMFLESKTKVKHYE